MTRIRLLHCIETIKSGGVERRRLSLAKYLDKEKFELKIICSQAIGPLAEAFKDYDVELIPIGQIKHPFHWESIQKVSAIIKSFQPHIIHGAVFEGVAMALVAGTLSKVPIRIGEETSDPRNRSKKADWLLKFLSLWADRMVAISPDVANYLKNRAKIASHKVVTITNGIEVPPIIADDELESWRTRLGLSPSDIVIGSVGRLLDEHKRFSDLLQAMALLVTNKSVKLLIVGGGKDEVYLKDLTKKLGLTDQVVFTGFQENTHIFYNLMDVFCIASSREGFGLVAAEAMMHCLPVIATKVGGLQNIVVEGETGFLVDPYSPDQIAEKLKVLINEPRLRDEFGKNGYQRAKINYSVVRYCNEIEDLYRQLLEEKNMKLG